MAVIEIPLRQDQPRFDFTVTLDSVAYTFFFSWSTRESAWYMSIFLEDETPIWEGVRVVVHWPLQMRSKSPLRPPGMFMAFDAEEQDIDPGLTDLGARVRLLYFDAGELAAMRASA